jgi:hypothetical protein
MYANELILRTPHLSLVWVSVLCQRKSLIIIDISFIGHDRENKNFHFFFSHKYIQEFLVKPNDNEKNQCHDIHASIP